MESKRENGKEMERENGEMERGGEMERRRDLLHFLIQISN